MQGVLYYILTVLIWGSTWFAIRFQLGEVSESVSLAYRFGLAASLLFLWCVVKGVNLRYAATRHVSMGAQGACLFSFNYLLFYWCTRYITSGLVAIIFSTVIVMNIVNGALFLKRRVDANVLIGALLGLCGICCVFWPEIQAASAQSQEQADQVLTGIAIGLAATYLASLGNILSAYNQSIGLPVLQTNAYGMCYGALLMTLYAWLTGARFNFDWGFSYVGSMLYLSVFGSIIAFGAYLTLIGRLGADRAAYATVLFPLVALAISSVFEGFLWTQLAIAGVALVLVGNVLVLATGMRQRNVVQGESA